MGGGRSSPPPIDTQWKCSCPRSSPDRVSLCAAPPRGSPIRRPWSRRGTRSEPSSRSAERLTKAGQRTRQRRARTESLYAFSFDHLVRAQEQFLRHGEPDRPGGPAVDRKRHPRRLLDRQLARLRALEDLVHVGRGALEIVED